MKRWLSVSCLWLCASCYHQNGIRVSESRWRSAVQSLSAQAEIDLHCETLDYELVERTAKEPTSIAVEGCGQRALYRRPTRGGVFRKRGRAWTLVTRD